MTQIQKLWRSILFFLFPVLLFVFSPVLCQAQTVRADNGVLSVPEWNFQENNPLALAGEWEVIWGELVDPAEFDTHYQGGFASIPRGWNYGSLSGFRHSYGVATYRVRLKLPLYNRALAFYLNSPNASWRLYVDDVLVGEDGVVSSNPKEDRPNYVSRILPAKDGESVLVLQMTNFSHAYGGLGHPIGLWDRLVLQKRLDTMSLCYALALAVLLSIGFFHLIFYFADRTDRLNGPVHKWFSILCFILVVRIFVVIPYLYIYFPHSPFWANLKLIYLILFFAPAIYLLFFRAAFPTQFPEKTTRAIITFCLVMVAFVLVTPELIYTYTRNFSIFLNLGVIFYSLVFTIYAIRAKEPGAIAILASNFIFLLTALNDAVIYTGNANGFDLAPFGVLVLGMGYSYALLLRLQRSFQDARRTSRALKTLNLELEKKVLDRTRAFKAAAARAENSVQQGAQFIAAASHDLRQPLHALALFNSALKRKVKNAAVMGLVEKQGRTIGNLGALLQDTLDTARIETNNKEPVWSSIELSSLLAEIAGGFGIQAEKQNIKLSFSCDKAMLVTDPGMLQRIVSNLIDNALKAARKMVEVKAVYTPDFWTITIADDGSGVAKEDASRIFESYFSLHDEEPGTQGGYGLGLYVVKEFTRLLGGSIKIVSTSETGSTFLLKLPHRSAMQEDLVDISEPYPNALPSSGMRILVIDDEPDILDAMGILLMSWECECRLANGLDQAQDHLSSGFEPQLLIVDFHLVGTDGLSVIQELRHHMRDDVPVLIVTGETEASILAKIRASGHRVLRKPINPDQLSMLLRSLGPD
jgi:signal transduction histidine kinase